MITTQYIIYDIHYTSTKNTIVCIPKVYSKSGRVKYSREE